MKILLIGLGKMGFNLAKNLYSNQFDLICYDKDEHVRNKINEIGIQTSESLEELFMYSACKKVVWLMLPSGKITNSVVLECLNLMDSGDILIDGGNTKFIDSKKHEKKAKEKNIDFLDIGTSGGVLGVSTGACMMIGGSKKAYNELESVFKSVCVPEGYLYCGAAGSGHYLKMIHNGIEYGMMQAIGEGFNILHHSEYSYELDKVSLLLNRGSVIRGWLMELTHEIYTSSIDLEKIKGVIPSSGEGKWTVEEILKLELTAPVITQALLTRYASNDSQKYSEKIVATLRNCFGGHQIIKKE